MPLNFNPGFSHPVIAPAAHPARNTPIQPVQKEPAAVEEYPSGRQKRAADYVAALRELKEEQQNPRQNLATRTYLQVAHYEGDFQLVDLYT